MNRSIFTIALAMTLLIYSAGVLADKLPKHYPESFQNMGEIDDLHKGFIVINDTQYILSPSSQVHTPRARFSTLGALKKGLQVAYTTTGKSGDTARKIAEIWVLPKRFKIENLE